MSGLLLWIFRSVIRDT